MMRNRAFRAVAGIAAILILFVAFLILNKSESIASKQSTDDAYVQADTTVVAPQVSGVIVRLLVEENQAVTAGDPLVNIDDRELRIAVDTATAAVDSLVAQLDKQYSEIKQTQASVAAASANLKLAEANRTRFSNLAKDGSGTVLAKQQSDTEWEIQRATLDREQAKFHATEQQMLVLQAEINKAKAIKNDAELKLSYSRIYAPVNGIVAQKAARIGNYINAGEPLLTLVPLDAVYVEANFRETQLASVQIGQPVQMTVDALPGVHLKGRVESLGPASGVSFSPVPAHNATGNFTKIVQRLPVRIHLESGQKDLSKLRVGMSVVPTIIVTQ
ncbi:HlyD family secretion protein [Enterobacter sp. ABFQC]|uniref:HlyD family secretion protein n=1 Tax=Enterobacter sp. ABFQC TaxID=1778656 RepID=UPI00136BF0D1|nr:HlyD family secretion protein [Enterobacter sp. ABFQC]MXV05463.1 efflux transporter periplasmic adaptor subunit [Enterobacter sp. ABFQC]